VEDESHERVGDDYNSALMLLAIDVGNTNTVLGVYDGHKLLDDWRLETHARRTYDEYGILIRDLFSWSKIDMSRVTAVAVSSVVPPLQFNLERMAQRYFKCKPMFVGPGVKTGMPILYDNPREVGADRIVNAVAAFEKHKSGRSRPRANTSADPSVRGSPSRWRRSSRTRRSFPASSSRDRRTSWGGTRCTRCNPASSTGTSAWWTGSANA
jgi:hypothetical protein